MARLPQLAARVAGTIALAAGFVWLVSRSPFLVYSGSPDGADAGPEADASRLMLPAISADTGIIPAEAFSMLESLQQREGFQPSMGLLRAEFAQTEDSPGFRNEERVVAGECTGAGLRYVRETCPGCTLTETAADDGMPPVVMWTEWTGPVPSLSAVTRDCVATGSDGESVISHLELGGDHLDLDGGMRAGDDDVVPLVPGGRRLAQIEMGGWVAVFDAVGRASTALRDMQRLLAEAGWRDAPSLTDEQWPYFEGQRVVVNDSGQYAIVGMNQHGDSYQLVTIVTGEAGG